MIWLTLRQYRTEAAIGILILVFLGIVFLNSGFTMYTTYQNMGLAACATRPCDNQIGYAFMGRTFDLASTISSFLQPWLCLFVAVFIGAPLVAREREQCTHYLIWTQSITRSRWLTVRLVLVVGTTLLAFAALAAMTTWWGTPLSTLLGPWLLYDIRGFVLPSYALFGLMLGITIGTFIRRTAPAMALTFVLLLVSSLALHNAYPYLVPPLSKTFALSDSQNARWGQPTDLTLYAGYADQAGHETGEISQYCNFNRTIADPDYGTLANKCISEHHLQWKIVYQPADRFWALQGVEAVILLLLGVALVPLTYWQLRKRIN